MLRPVRKKAMEGISLLGEGVKTIPSGPWQQRGGGRSPGATGLLSESRGTEAPLAHSAPAQTHRLPG